MGFDINPPSNKPIIREAASMQNDGGAGNLGYFEREEKEKKKKEKSIFSDEKESDSFKKESETTDEEIDFSISKIIAEFIYSVKDFFKSLFIKK